MSMERPKSNNDEQLHQLSKKVLDQNKSVEEQFKQVAEMYNVRDEVDLENLSVSDIPRRLEEVKGSEDIVERMIEKGMLYSDANKYLEEYGKGLFEDDTVEKGTYDSFGTFFEMYGKDLLSDSHYKEAVSEDVLSDERKDEIELFLLGDKVFNNRRERLRVEYGEEIPSEALDATRKNLLRSYVKGIAREGYKEENPEVAWQNLEGPSHELQRKTMEGLSFSAHEPARELLNFLQQKGSEKFLFDSDLGDERRSLYEIMDLQQIQKDFDEVKEKSSEEELSSWVVSTVDSLSAKVKNQFKYSRGANSFATISETGAANCAGYTLIGKLLLEELGIPHTYIGGDGHAFVGYTTHDKSVQLNHFQGDGSVSLQDKDLDRVSVHEVQEFIDSDEKGVMSARLSIGTPVNWWAPDHDKQLFQERLYMYKGVDSHLLMELSKLDKNQGKALTPEQILGKEDVIDPVLVKTREEIIDAIRSSPEDPELYIKLSDNQVQSSEAGSSKEFTKEGWDTFGEARRLAKEAEYYDGPPSRDWFSKIKKYLKR